jgi:hypothetical protein
VNAPVCYVIRTLPLLFQQLQGVKVVYEACHTSAFALSLQLHTQSVTVSFRLSKAQFCLILYRGEHSNAASNFMQDATDIGVVCRLISPTEYTEFIQENSVYLGTFPNAYFCTPL